MRLPVWRLEWRTARRRRRLFLLNTGVPLLLVLPVALSDAPTFHAAAVYTVLFVLFGLFGQAIPLLRDGEQGLLRRLVLTGYGERPLAAERILAGSALDLLQLSPALAVIVWTWAPSWTALATTAPALTLTLITANSLGFWVAAGARSLAEGALLAAVTGILLVHGAGAFRTPAPGSAAEILALVLPFGLLHRVHLSLPGSPSPTWEAALPAMAITVLALGLTVAAAPSLLRRIGGERPS